MDQVIGVLPSPFGVEELLLLCDIIVDVKTCSSNYNH